MVYHNFDVSNSAYVCPNNKRRENDPLSDKVSGASNFLLIPRRNPFLSLIVRIKSQSSHVATSVNEPTLSKTSEAKAMARQSMNSISINLVLVQNSKLPQMPAHASRK